MEAETNQGDTFDFIEAKKTALEGVNTQVTRLMQQIRETYEKDGFFPFMVRSTGDIKIVHGGVQGENPDTKQYLAFVRRNENGVNVWEMRTVELPDAELSYNWTFDPNTLMLHAHTESPRMHQTSEVEGDGAQEFLDKARLSLDTSYDKHVTAQTEKVKQEAKVVEELKAKVSFLAGLNFVETSHE